MKLIIMQSSPASHHFFPYTSKYSPQHPVLLHPLSIFGVQKYTSCISLQDARDFEWGEARTEILWKCHYSTSTLLFSCVQIISAEKGLNISYVSNKCLHYIQS